jgi:uncharacterized protein
MTQAAAPPRPVASPCVQVCAVDGRTGLCFGCRRTLPEIARWSRMSDAERSAVLAHLPDRPDPTSDMVTASPSGVHTS